MALSKSFPIFYRRQRLFSVYGGLLTNLLALSVVCSLLLVLPTETTAFSHPASSLSKFVETRFYFDTLKRSMAKQILEQCGENPVNFVDMVASEKDVPQSFVLDVLRSNSKLLVEYYSLIREYTSCYKNVRQRWSELQKPSHPTKNGKVHTRIG